MRGRAGASAALIVVLLGACATALAETPEQVFDAANEAYDAGRYRDAVDGYARVLRYGVEDVRVEYNLGNAAFKLGRVGEAILHWERAYRLDPTDGDVRANLAFARGLLQDRIDAPDPTGALAFVRNVQNRIGPDRQAVGLLVLGWGLAALLSWCWARPGGFTPPAAWVLAGLLLVGAVVGVSWWTTKERLETRHLAVVVVDAADVLAGPGENNAPLVTVHEGLTLRVRSERGDWIQVGLPDGLNGWVRRRAVGIV